MSQPRTHLVEKGQSPRKDRPVAVADIIRFEASMKYVVAHTEGGEYLLNDTLTSLATEFSDRFFPIHRTHLVERSRVVAIVPGNDSIRKFVVMSGVPVPIPIARRSYRLLLQQFPHLKTDKQPPQ